MGTIKISITEKDGEEYDYAVEMDLASALNYIGIDLSGSIQKELLVDKNFNILFSKDYRTLEGKV